MPAPGNTRRKLLLAVVFPPLLLAALAVSLEALLACFLPRTGCYWVRDSSAPTPRLVPASRPPVRSAAFWPAALPVGADPGVRRVLCLGGSTTHGHPFDPPAGFVDWLAARLPLLLPGSTFEVVNLGANGLNARSVADVWRDVEDTAPDVVVVYCGHNEFLDQNLDDVRHPGRAQLRRLLERTRLGSWLLERLRPAPDLALSGALRGGTVHDAPLLTATELQQGYLSYEDSMREILERCARRHAVAVLVQPVADLVDTPPSSSFRPATSAAARAQFRELQAPLDACLLRLREGGGTGERSAALQEAGELLDRLQVLDPAVPSLAYARGRCLQAAGRDAEAWEAFEQARDQDREPIRATARIREILARLAAEFHAVIVDPEPALHQAAPHGLPGQNGFFVDYCHPDLEGHWLIANAVLQALAAQGVLAPGPAWQFASEPPRAETEARMGLTRDAQAGSLARRGLGVLAQSYFQEEPQGLHAAHELFTLALKTDERCALAHAGVGFLACMEHDPGTAERELLRAHALDPASLQPFLEAYDAHPTVRRIFQDAGFSFQDGRPVRGADPPP